MSLSSSLSDVSSSEEVEEETLLVFNELDATERGVADRGVIALGVLLEPRVPRTIKQNQISRNR